MAKILKGKRKGETIEKHQFCNDWVTDDQNNVYGITSLEFTDDEIAKLKKRKTGQMFIRFELVGNRFKKRKFANATT